MIKLNIQRFGHTNSTPNYELPQFVGTDKPQWLTDINQGFLAIDTAIHNAYALASLTSTNVGDISDLTTTVKTDVVSAVNEINGGLGNLGSTVASHTTAIGNNTTAIGTLANLSTTAKTDLVSAVNEVDNVATNNATNIGNLNNLDTTNKNNLVGAVNEINSELPDYYNTVEHKTNKIWIDNKPVYRIVLSDNLPDSVGGWHNIDVSSLNIDHLVDLHMKFISSGDEEYFNNFYINENYALTIRYARYNNQVQYNIGNGYASTSASYRLIIEYTKNN